MGPGGADVPDRQTLLTDGSASRGFASLDPRARTRGGDQQQQQQQRQKQQQKQLKDTREAQGSPLNKPRETYGSPVKINVPRK